MIRLRLKAGCEIAVACLWAGVTSADTVTIGVNGINSVGLGNGSGVVIGQVEQGRPGDAGAGDDLEHRNTTTDPAQVFDITFFPADSANVRDHAQEVAGVMISTDTTDGEGDFDNEIAPTGVAPGASLYSAAYITEGTGLGYQDAILTLQHIAGISGMRAVNHSWGKPSDFEPLDGSSLLTLAFDWSVTRHNVLHIIAGNQGVGGTPIPKDNYNGMTIGRSAKDAFGVYRVVSSGNNTGEDADGDRTSIALIAPGDDIELTGLENEHRITAGGSSYAAPHVTGTVALLQQGVFGTNPRRPQVMKAVLMNSADKIKDIIGMERTVENGGNNWFDTDAHSDPNIPLDISMGAGHLNASRAKTQFDAGERGPGGVGPIGWDWGTQNDPFIPNSYSLALDEDDWVSATLVWDREVILNSPNPDYEPGDEFLDLGFANFDLYLVPAGGGIQDAIAWSTSTAQNVEHIFAQVPEDGNYEIQVWIGELNEVSYALAWWAGADNRAKPGDHNSDGNVDAADYVVWRKNDNTPAGYDEWRANYGATSGSGSLATVPEPSAIMLLAIGALLWRPRRSRS